MPLPPELQDKIKERIKEGKKRVRTLEPEIQKAKAAGIDVSRELKEFAKLKRQLADLELQYGK